MIASLTSSRRAVLLVALAGSAAAFCACILWLRDPDMFHHLAMGRHIARHGLSPEEPFLYPLLGAAGGPPPYWLGSLAIYGWHALLGDGGLAFLPALAGAVLFGILFADCAPRGGRHGALTIAAALPPLVLAMESFRARATARPELFGTIFIALTALLVRRFEDGRARWLLAFPLLALLWTNVHPSVTAGLALVAILAASAALGGPPAKPRAAATAALVLAAASLATAATPCPANPVAVALRLAGTMFGIGGAAAGGGAAPDSYLPVRMLVAELAPARLESLRTAPGLLLCLTALSFLLRWRRARPREIASVAVFAVLASGGVRFAAVLAVVCAPIAARNLGEALSSIPERLGRVPLRAAAAVALALAGAVHPALATTPPQASFGTRPWPAAYPVRGADYLASIGFDGRLFNTFHFGGYLEWRGLPAYQDGRGTVPEGTLEASIIGPDDPKTFAALDARWGFDALVLQYRDLSGAPLESLVALKGEDDWIVGRDRWALVAFDDAGLLYLRRDGKYAERAARDEYRLAKPGNAGVQIKRSTFAALLAEYERSVREAPSCHRCRFLFATCALAGGMPAEAERMVAPALEDAPRFLPDLLLVAARAAEAQGKGARAAELYRRFLATGEDDPEARRGLARVSLAGGDADAVSLAAAARPDPMAEARQHFDRALASERAGDLEGSAASYAASLSIFEANPAAHSNLGYVLEKMGRLDEAVREQRRAALIDPDLAAAHYGLGSALAARGDRPGAAAAFRRYLALEPHGQWALKATQRLAELERP
ncbi:MAG TPA: tetratricopeptide repeat protein [Anaeromyxobacter sp.]